MAVTLQRSLLPRGLPEQNAAGGRLPLPARAGRGRRRLVRRHPAARRPGRPGRRRRRRATACTPPPPWGGCAPRCTTSPPSTCRPTSSSATSTNWSAASTRTRRAERRQGRRGHRRHLPVRGLRPGDPQLHPGPRRPPAARRWSAPTGRVEFPDVPAGPPLGLGGLPFETAELDLAEGSRSSSTPTGWSRTARRDIDDGPGTAAQALLERAGDRPRRPAGPCSTRCRPGPERRHRPARRPHPALGRRPGRRLGRAADPAAVAEVRAAVSRAAQRTGAWTSWRSPPN